MSDLALVATHEIRYEKEEGRSQRERCYLVKSIAFVLVSSDQPSKRLFYSKNRATVGLLEFQF